MMRSLPALSLAVAVVVHATCGKAHAEAGVVVSIKPIHSLVAGVMRGVGEPHLIVRGGGSPHTYAMKPSDARALANAKLVVWVGEALERFLEEPIKSLAAKAAVLELAEAPGLTTLAYREGGPWGEHDHDQERGDHHAETAHKGEHGDAETKDRAQHQGEDHGHDNMDMHLWLDPDNARAFVRAIVAALIEVDMANAGAYEANGAALIARLDALTATIARELAPVKDRPFVVFHDAYQYLENRFGLNAVGSVTVSPDIRPGAKRLEEIRAKIAGLGAICVFSEPQFEPKLVRVLTEGTSARSGVLDPLGADLADGPDLYFALMEQNTKALKDCLAGTS